MTRLKNIVYIVLILPLLLNYTPIADSQEVTPVTYRAEFIPFGKGLTWKEAIPPGGGALGLDFEFVFSPGSVTAEVAGEIRFSEGTRTIAVHGTGGHLSSDGGVVLKGDIVMNFMIPLPEAFFEEDDSFHIDHHRVPIPGLNINKGWNESETFNSFLLSDSYPESVKLDIRIPQLITMRLSAVEIVPVVASAILSGGTLTAAVKIFVDNLSDYLDAGISLNGGITSELTLAGKTITVNGTPVTHENRLIRAPDFDPAEKTYQIQSNYDEEFTYTLDIVASSNAYAKVTVLGGIEIWSYDQRFAQKRIPIIPKDTFDLNFGGAAASATIDVPTKPSEFSGKRSGTKLIPDGDLAYELRRTRNWDWDHTTRENLLRLTTLFISGGPIDDLTGLEHAVNLRELHIFGTRISDVSPLSGLKNLETLDLFGNVLSEVSLSDMPSLESLNLSGNVLSEVSLSDMPNLTKLELSGNPLSKVSLSDMPSLKILSGLHSNALSKVSLSNMSDLEALNFGGSTISELSLSGLTNLTELSTTRALSGSTILKLSASGLTNLTGLGHLGSFYFRSVSVGYAKPEGTASF